MREWTVSLAWDATSPVTLEALDDLAELVGVAGGEPGHQRVDTTMTVTAGDPGTAAAKAFTMVKKAIPGEIVAVEVMTTEEQDRRLAEPAFPELVGVTEVAQVLGVSRQRASALQKMDGFPGPVAELASGPIWRRTDLSRFQGTWKRTPGRPSKERGLLDRVHAGLCGNTQAAAADALVALELLYRLNWSDQKVADGLALTLRDFKGQIRVLFTQAENDDELIVAAPYGNSIAKR